MDDAIKMIVSAGVVVPKAIVADSYPFQHAPAAVRRVNSGPAGSSAEDAHTPDNLASNQ